MNDFNYDNEIIEIDSEESQDTENEKVEENLESSNEVKKEVKKEKHKRSLKDRWNHLDKKNKVFIILSAVILFILILGLVLFFIFRNKNEEKPIKPDETVVIEKDNYKYVDGKLIFLDINEREIGSYECTNKNDQECFVSKIDYSLDKFDRIKNVNESGIELDKTSQIYYDDFVFVTDGTKSFLYSIKTKEQKIDVKSIKTYNTSKNLVVYEDNNSRYGLMEITESGYTTLINPTYDYLGIVNSEINYLIAKDKDNTYVIDSTGKKLSKNIKEEIKSVNTKFIVATSGNTYNLYGYDDDELVSDYSYISLHGDVIALVKGNRLYLLNDELNKLLEDGIRLENSNYVKQYVYDNDNRLIETKKSYEIELKNDVISVTVGDDTKEVNPLEGEVSSKFDYMNYFDGKLYFYSNSEKTDLIGTYNCSNKNNITSSSSNLTNCNILSKEDKFSGIYNNEYVFIFDSDGSDIRIYLYDLKAKQSKGTYSDINIINATELNSTIKPLYTSSSYIIAKSATGNNSGNYGVLEINSNKANGKIEFKYKNINKVYNYYLLINIDNKYSIYDDNFKKISNEFDFIELYENYYVGINNNKLNVYNYVSGIGILEEELDVTNNEYTIEFKDGFNITINGETYSYDKEGKIKDGE